MGSDAKRYYVEMGGSVRDRRTEQNMGSREIRDRLNALEAERDALRSALERIVQGFPNDDNKGNLWNVYPNTYTGDPEQVQENPYDVARAMYAIATQALTKGGGDETE